MVCEFSGDRLLLCIKTAQAVFLHLVVLGGGKPYADFGAQRQQVAFYRIVSCLLNRLFRMLLKTADRKTPPIYSLYASP